MHGGPPKIPNRCKLVPVKVLLFYVSNLYLLFSSSPFWYNQRMKHTHTVTNLPIENQYPKLVRDKIPTMIERDGKIATVHIADGADYVDFLLAKLIEEATELRDAECPEHQKEEIADVKEVLGALLNALGFSEEELKEIQASKLEERGGFEGRIILDLKPEL